MAHIIDNVYLASCADVSQVLDKCSDLAVIVGDDLNNTIPVAICYLMSKYGQSYEAARNFIFMKLDKSTIPEKYGCNV